MLTNRTSGEFPRIYLSPTGSPSPYLIEPGHWGIFPVLFHSPLTDFSVAPVRRTLRGNRTMIFHSPLTDFSRLSRTPIFTRKPDYEFFTRWFLGLSTYFDRTVSPGSRFPRIRPVSLSHDRSFPELCSADKLAQAGFKPFRDHDRVGPQPCRIGADGPDTQRAFALTVTPERTD